MSELIDNDELLQRLETAIARAGGIKQWTRENGFTYQYVKYIRNSTRPISKTFAAALGYECVMMFRSKADNG